MGEILNAIKLKREAKKRAEAAEIYNRMEFLAKSKGETGQTGAKGDKGDQGDQGQTGPMPKHEWQGTKLRFEVAPNRWGEYVDLRGPAGLNGTSSRGESAYGGRVLEPLPVSTDSVTVPDKIALRQGGVWVQIGWSDFLTLVGNVAPPAAPMQVVANGNHIVVNGNPVIVTE